MIDEAIARTLLGDSPAMVVLRRLIARVGPSQLPVMIEGPTGAGKELVAQALHLASGRTGELVAVNICAIPDTIFEDALFGHVRGAFTGATATLDGYLAQAHRGTAFLDEIGGLAGHLQIKLLRAIETKTFRPVGARCDHRADFRLVTATNEPVAELLRAGRIRPDLAERLCGFVLQVPPLADRRDDIPLLARHFLDLWGAEEKRTPPQLSIAAASALRAHSWPRNVRELRNVVIRSATLVDGCVIRVEDVRLSLDRQHPPRRPPNETFLQQRMLAVIRECNGDTAAAAQRLGMHRATLYRRMRRFGLDVRFANVSTDSPRGAREILPPPNTHGQPAAHMCHDCAREPLNER